jgi:NAD(P)-dependent dehydrogenase (short-subunit alcohol dehydrogenase family)
MSTPTLSILITGSNQGLGFETAIHLSKHAHIHLFVSGRNPSRVQEAVEKITKEKGCKAVVDSIVIDVGDDESINAGVKDVEAKLNGAALDVLVVRLLRRLSVTSQLIVCMCRTTPVFS